MYRTASNHPVQARIAGGGAVAAGHERSGYRDRLTDECRRVARLTPEEDAAAAGFARLAERTEGWRQIPKPSGAAS